MVKCFICGEGFALDERGTCRECLEAESIISCGKNLSDNNRWAVTPVQKLLYLIECGWVHREHLQDKCRVKKPSVFKKFIEFLWS